MKKTKPAQTEYEVAVQHLQKFCEKETDLQPLIIDDQYPIRVQFIPKPQLTVFGDENINENGEFNDLTVTVGLTTAVKSTLKFKMDSALLKKLIKLAEKVGTLFYHAFHEEQGERIAPKRPVVIDNVAVCPCCGQHIAVTEDPFRCCLECGQALDWTPEPSADYFEEKMEELRRKIAGEEAKQ